MNQREDPPASIGPVRHRPSGRWKLGFALSAITTCFWGTAPIALSLLLDQIDAPTTTFYRFASVSVVLALVLAWKGQLPPCRQLMSGSRKWPLVIAGAGLTGNFAIYQYALNYFPPGAAQLVMQIAPFLVLAGSVVLYREPFSRTQRAGVALLISGLLLFFNKRLSEFTGSSSDYAVGAALIMCAGIACRRIDLARSNHARQRQPAGTVRRNGCRHRFDAVFVWRTETTNCHNRRVVRIRR